MVANSSAPSTAFMIFLLFIVLSLRFSLLLEDQTRRPLRAGRGKARSEAACGRYLAAPEATVAASCPSIPTYLTVIFSLTITLYCLTQVNDCVIIRLALTASLYLTSSLESIVPMSDSSSPASPDLLRLSAQIVSAHVANNAVPANGMPSLIRSVYAALAGVEQPVADEPEPQQPAVPIKRSVFPDYIVCLEDGKKLKTLKRHLQAHFGLTPETYRAKWGLPRDYPMVAPDYAMQRSTLAKQFGLGRQSKVEAPVPQVFPAKKRGRPAKAAVAGT